MNKNKEYVKTLICILITFFILIIFAVAIGYNFFHNIPSIADNDIITELPSPDNKYKAIIFQRTAGATTEKSYHLSVLKKGKSLKNSIGNVFISDSEFSINWLDSSNLLITQTKGRIYNKQNKIGKINISYLE